MLELDRVGGEEHDYTQQEPADQDHDRRVAQRSCTRRLEVQAQGPQDPRADDTDDDNQRSELCAAPRPGANSASAAAPVDAPDARNSAPSQGLSAQIGRFVTESKTPV